MSSAEQKQPFWKRTGFVLVLLPVLAVAFNWPYLTGGFACDDILFLNMMDQDPLPYSRWLGVWSMNDYPFLDHLWWKDWKDPGEGGLFWRPIPSLVIEGSIHLFGETAFPLHLLSLVLHGGIAVGLYFLVRMLCNRHGLALLAGLFFVTCEDHSMVVGWIATIPDPLCVLFILIALLCHVRWLKDRKPAALAGSLLALIAAMACKETASIAPVAMVLLTFFMPKGIDEGDAGLIVLKKRVARGLRDPASWLPAILILMVYLGMYKALGLGSLNTLVYINPLDDPIGYLGHMVLHLPVLWLGTFTPVPPSLTMMLPGSLLSMAILGLVAFVACLLAILPFRHRAVVQWALVLYMVALLPQVSTDASERGLYFPLIPAAILLAALAMAAGPLVRRMIPKPPALPRWTRIMGVVVLLGVLVPGILLSTAMPWLYLAGFTKPDRELRTALPYVDQEGIEHVLILNASSFMLTIYSYDTLHYLLKRPQDSWLLSAAHGVFTLERTGDASFVIRTDRPGWLNNIFVRMLRAGSRLKPGKRHETELFHATLMELTKSKRDVLAVRFELNRPLDDPACLFLRWNGDAFEPLDIAALETGETVELADTSDLWKAMF